jgi:hypothetical protein
MGFPKGASIPFGQERSQNPAREAVLFNWSREPSEFDAKNKVALKVDSSSANPYAIIPTSVTGLLKEEDTELKAFKSSLLAKRSLKDNPTRAWFQ